MSNSSPKALILGIDNFVARKLALALVNKDINVIGVGNYVSDLANISKIKLLDRLDNLDILPNYIFDFNGEIDNLENFVSEDIKITVISVNNEDKSAFIQKQLRDFRGNWRFIEAYGVYGPNGEDDNFLNRAIRQSVLNENLILPPISSLYRILAVDDLIEAILRASFFSGTSGENFLIVGREINSERVAKILIDEAKMTKVRVIQNEIKLDYWENSQVLKNWQKLRWQPEIDFEEGIKETLQYFFSKADEEKRNKNKKPVVKEIFVEKPIKKEKEKKIFKVEIEETEPEVLVKKEEVKEIEEEIEDLEEAREVVEKEEVFDFKPIVIKKKDLEKIEEMSREAEVKIDEIKEEVKVKKIVKKWRLPVLLLIFLMIMSVPMTWFLTGVKTIKSLDKVKDLVQKGKYDEAQKEIVFRTIKIKKVNEGIDNLGINNFLMGRRYQELLRVGEEGLNTGLSLVKLMEYSSKITDYVMADGESVDWEKDIKLVKDELLNLAGKVGVLRARIGGDWQWLPYKIKTKMDDLALWVDNSKNVVDIAIDTVNILPSFVGAEDGRRKDYLVLLQNEMELRAGGGFIGSFGILSFQEGKLIGFEIKDVYEADGQLKGHVEPPEEIKKYLGEAAWFMRDANWQADFVGSSKDIQWFYEKSTGRKVDGVIGINLAVARKIVEVIGEIKVPDFEEKITKNNLYEQAQFYAETKFFPGSNRKASFLSSLGRQLFEEIDHISSDKKFLIVKELVDLLERNEVQVALNDNEMARKMSNNGWDGSVFKGQCADDRCVADYMYIVESNFGVNKANYFIYRNIEQTVAIENEGIRRVVKINYENTAKTSGWPGGDYKNYIRIYLPLGALVEKVEGVEKGEQIKIIQKHGKQEVGFLTKVEINSKKTVELHYFIKANIASFDKFSYLNYVQRQSGFGDTNLVSLVSYPNNWQPLQVEPMATMVGGNLLFNQKLDRDLRIGVEIGK